jgi:hypothetical protein
MLSAAPELLAVQQVAELEPSVARLETCLNALSSAMCRHDAAALDQAAQLLHRALATAVADFQRAARVGGVPPELRRRLMLASGQVAAQRDALARATASLDRAIDVLLPGAHAPALYDAQGASVLAQHGGLHA